MVAVLEVKEKGEWSATGGKLCFTPSTWADYTEHPYQFAMNPIFARPVARMILRNAIFAFEAEGIKPTPFLLAYRWRWGLTGAIHWVKGYGPALVKRAEYADQARNLYDDPTFKP